MQLKIVFWVYNYVLRAMFDIRQDKYDNSLEFHLHSHSNKIYLKYTKSIILYSSYLVIRLRWYLSLAKFKVIIIFSSISKVN